MKSKYLKVACLTILVGVMMCAVVHAHKHKEKKVCLPEAVKAAINNSYPKAEIKEKEKECEGLKVYEVELEQDGKKLELTITPEGTIVEVETKVCIVNLPKPVADAINKTAEGAKVKYIEKVVAHAALKFVKLDTAKTTYEAKIIKDEKKTKIEVAEDGTILKQSEHKKGEEYKKCEEYKKHKCASHDHDKDDDKD